MDKSKFNCVEYFPKILESSHEKIINCIYQNRENTTFSHRINGRWENQYLSIQYFPQLRKLFRNACREGKAILEKSLVVPYKELGLPMDEFWFNITAPGESTGWHDHKERSELSGVYYLHVPDNSGDIHFRKKDDDETFEWEIKSQAGKLIIFESYCSVFFQIATMLMKHEGFDFTLNVWDEKYPKSDEKNAWH